MDRRKFIAGAALTSASLATAQTPTQKTGSQARRTEYESPRPTKAVIVCKTNQNQAIDGAYQMLLRGADTLDAALFVCKAQEDDPKDTSVGLGGLPNEEGEVELDACCMHGPSRRAGAVAGVRRIRNVAALAQLVMDRTSHVMLVGEGAQRFARAHGFQEENLLTEDSRKTWLLWKESHSRDDWWGPGLADPNWKPPADAPPLQPPRSDLRERAHKLYELAADFGISPELRWDAVHKVLFPPTGTIHVSVVNAKGEMSGATTTSGLAWKLPGRAGDSPIIGAGCYTDQDIGSAGATGSGEENIKVCGAHTIVEFMRQGRTPQEAGLETLRRIARNHNNDMSKLRYLNMVYYILRRDGAYAGVSLWSHGSTGRKLQFMVHDGTKRVEDTVSLFQGTPLEWPPQREAAARR